jgi:hypothetical protein
MKLETFTLVSNHGSRCRFYLTSRRVDGRPYLVGGMAAAYVANVTTGECVGVEGCAGQTLWLVPNALKRLRKLTRVT